MCRLRGTRHCWRCVDDERGGGDGVKEMVKEERNGWGGEGVGPSPLESLARH